MATDNPTATGSPQLPKPSKTARRAPARKTATKVVEGDGNAVPTASAVLPQSKARKPTAKKVSIEDIQLRAYFIAEARQKAGKPGTPEDDWLEAERQLGVTRGKSGTSPKPKAKRTPARKPVLG